MRVLASLTLKALNWNGRCEGLWTNAERASQPIPRLRGEPTLGRQLAVLADQR